MNLAWFLLVRRLAQLSQGGVYEAIASGRLVSEKRCGRRVVRESALRAFRASRAVVISEA